MRVYVCVCVYASCDIARQEAPKLCMYEHIISYTLTLHLNCTQGTLEKTHITYGEFAAFAMM